MTKNEKRCHKNSDFGVFINCIAFIFACIFVEILHSMFIHNTDINQILTKYFYEDNQLCYQIMVQTKNNELYNLEKYVNYSEYMRAFAQIEERFKSGMVIEIKQTTSDFSMLGKVA